MEKKGSRLPFKEAYRVNQKAFRLIFKQDPGMFLSRILCAVWDSLTPYVGIYLSALLIQEISTDRDPDRLAGLVWAALISEAVILLVSAFLIKWRDTQSAGMYFKVKQIFTEKLLDMDYASIDNTKTHELLSTIEQNQNGGGWGLFKVIGNYETIISSILTLFGGIALSVTLFTTPVPESAGALQVLNHPLFTAVFILVLFGVTYLSPALANYAESFYARLADSHNLGNRLFGFFGWLGYREELAADMRIYRQDIICDKHNADKTDVFGSKGIFSRYAKGPMGLCRAASAGVSVLFTGFVYGFICLKAWAGAFGVGMVTQYIASVSKLAGGVSSLIAAGGDMRNNASFLKLVFDFLEIESTMERKECAASAGDGRDYEIQFKNVSFQYPGSEEYALKDINVTIKAGQRMAVVGQNGSGKTTFIKLLCRLYDPTQGVILLNGRDIKEYSYGEYMGLFSAVFQDFKLFAFPLGENVGAKAEYDEELVRTCLEKAGFGQRLAGMPEGLKTYLYKEFSKTGVLVSGGEAQKIALARSLYKDALFIILDEPTAALDPIAEAEVYSNFNSIVGDKTAIYISHRLSSCRFCEDIVVFHQGEIVQRGSHEQLLEDGTGKYCQLWNAQAQYYAE